MCFRNTTATPTRLEMEMALKFLETRTVSELLYLYPKARVQGKSFTRDEFVNSIMSCYIPKEVQDQYVWAIIVGGGRLPQ